MILNWHSQDLSQIIWSLILHIYWYLEFIMSWLFIFYLYQKRSSGKSSLSFSPHYLQITRPHNIDRSNIRFDLVIFVAYGSLLIRGYLLSNPDICWIIGSTSTRMIQHQITLGVLLIVAVYAIFYCWWRVFYLINSILWLWYIHSTIVRSSSFL